MSQPPAPTPTVAERMAAGKQWRTTAPRSSHGTWSPQANRPDPVALLHTSDAARLTDLLPLRYARMAASPFAFLRGAALIMASDLVGTPETGLRVQACGDAHVANFGAYGTPERQVVFDVNDFDETLPAAWEWDVKRLATSIVVAARVNRIGAPASLAAGQASVRAYREAMQQYAQMGYLAVWYADLSAQRVLTALPAAARLDARREFAGAASNDDVDAEAHLTRVVDGHVRFADRPPLLTHVADERMGQHLLDLHRGYRDSVRDDLRDLLDRYTYVDFARKVVGVGSVGTRCYVLLLHGADSGDPLLLQIKEATASVLEAHAGKSAYRNHGQRVVFGQRRTQAAPDIFLGWGEYDGVHYYVRQLVNMKARADIAAMRAGQLQAYAGLCGWALARAHARSGDPARIAGYLGNSDIFDQAITRFASAYADQTERDHAALVASLRSHGSRAVEVRPGG